MSKKAPWNQQCIHQPVTSGVEMWIFLSPQTPQTSKQRGGANKFRTQTTSCKAKINLYQKKKKIGQCLEVFCEQSKLKIEKRKEKTPPGTNLNSSSKEFKSQHFLEPCSIPVYSGFQGKTWRPRRPRCRSAAEGSGPRWLSQELALGCGLSVQHL